MYKIPANSLFVGHKIVFVPECHSTNSEAILLTDDNSIGDGTVVVTNNQLSGRGQRGNVWNAQPGKNLTFSIILKPSFLGAQSQFLLNIVISLALHDFLLDHGVPSPKIKWPNDILVDGKKISGILIENQVKGNKITNSIIGVGLNINQESFPYSSATSLKSITNEEYDLSASLIKVLEKIEARYLVLRSGNQKLLVENYESHMFWRGEQHSFFANEKNFQGVIKGLARGGQLEIETENGLMNFGIKEVKYIS